MPPPRNRRPGFSRRIQFGLFIGYVVAIVGAVLSLGLALISRLDPAGFSMMRTGMIDISAPIAAGGRAIIRSSGAVEHGVTDYFFAVSQNRVLLRELAAARRKLIENRGLERENIRLRQAVSLIEAHDDVVVTARLIGSTPTSTRRFATLAAGANQGVRPGQPVRAVDGLLGRVLQTGLNASRILMLTDGESAVPVRLARNGVPALARGHGDGTLTIHALLPGGSPFRDGDVVLTSGTGGIYPPDIPVAIISHPKGDSAAAWPLADPDSPDFAIVLKDFEPPLPPPPEAQP